MDDYGSQDTSSYSNTYETNNYDYNDRDNQQYSHQYDYDKSNDFSSPKENKYSESSDHDKNTVILSSSDNDGDNNETAKHSFSQESQDLTPQSDTDNYKWLEQEDSNSNNATLQRDEYQPIINQQPKSNETKFMSDNDSNYENDCCPCKNEPLMCLAIVCECLCF